MKSSHISIGLAVGCLLWSGCARKESANTNAAANNPTNSAEAGQTATFNATGTNGAPLSYQWYNGTNQPGKAFATKGGSTVNVGAVTVGGTNVPLTNIQVR